MNGHGFYLNGLMAGVGVHIVNVIMMLAACGAFLVGFKFLSDNMEKLAVYCKEHIAPERLLGFIQTTWASVEEKYSDRLTDGAIALGEAIRAFGND